MVRELRGTRYLPWAKPDLGEFIVTTLPRLDYQQTLNFYGEFANHPKTIDADRALMNCNDRYYLLTMTCKRRDAWHPWLFDRCREIEADPDGYLDLWARYHYKSS